MGRSTIREATTLTIQVDDPKQEVSRVVMQPPAENIVNEKARETPSRRRVAGRGFLSIIVGMALWEAAIPLFKVNPYFLVAPSAVVRELFHVFESGDILPHLSASLQAYALGLFVASVIGVVLGLVTGASRQAHDIAQPWVSGLYSTPMLAFAPLLVVIFGYGMSSKIAVVIVTCIFPVLINTDAGVRNVDREYIDVARAFGASRWEAFRKIYLPASLPYVLTGIRLAVGRGLIAVIAADLFGAKLGLGLLLQQSAQFLDTAKILSIGFILALLGITLAGVVSLVEKVLLHWQER